MACLNTRDNCLKLWRNARNRDYNECNAIILDGVIMATMTIRNLDDELKARLRIRAAQHGKSMEEEARSILRDALKSEPLSGKELVSHTLAVLTFVLGMALIIYLLDMAFGGAFGAISKIHIG